MKKFICAICISLTGVTAPLWAMETQMEAQMKAQKAAALKTALIEALDRGYLAAATELISTGGIPLGQTEIDIIKNKNLAEGLVKKAIEEGHPLAVHILVAKNLLSKESAQKMFNEYTGLVIDMGRDPQKLKHLLQTDVRKLIDLDKENSDSYTALMWAAQFGHKEIVELLIKADADLNKQTSYGNTALIVTARFGHKEIVELLIKAGADLNKQDRYGSTALILAAEYGRKEIVELLKEAMEKQNANEKNN